MKSFFRKKLLPKILFCCLLFSFFSCSNSPTKIFEVVVLNTNAVAGFADRGLSMQLESPSEKLVEGTTDQSVPMKRSEIVNDKIKFADESLNKINGLGTSDDSKEMIETSKSLYEYILPVYKNEYTELAKLYDSNAPPEQTQALIKSIHDKYYAGYKALYDKLINQGKVYAAKHNIKVNWN